MFTVKVYRNGQLSAFGCDRYTVDLDSPRRIELYSRAGGWESVDVEASDDVFIENLAGRTVHAIRAPRG